MPHADLWAVDRIAGCCWGPIELELARIVVALDRAGDARAHLSGARGSVERAGARLLLRDLQALERRCDPLEPSSLAAPSDTAARHANIFRCDGQFWTLSYDGRTVRMKDAKGLADLARLIARPGSEIHVLDLAGPGSDPISGTLGRADDLGELLDARALGATTAAEARDHAAASESLAFAPGSVDDLIALVQLGGTFEGEIVEPLCVPK